MTSESVAGEHARQSRSAAEAGDPQAMTRLAGELLQQGQHGEAELWYARAADAGEPSAMAGLGYVLSRRGAQNDAVGWWRRAATAGDRDAMGYLANALRAKDPAEAERWGWFAEAAGRDVATETVPDEVAAAARGLGTLRSVIGRETQASSVGCMAAGGALGLVVAGIGVAMTTLGAPSGWATVLLLVGAAIAVWTAALVFSTRNNVPVRIWRFDDGIVHRDAKGTLDVLRWSEIRVLRNITRHYRGPRYENTTFTYTLERSTGDKLVLRDDLFPKGELCVLGDTIEREVAAIRLPGAVAAIHRGECIEFGNIAVHADGISHGRRHLPWHEVQAVETANGWLQVKRSGRWLRWGSTPVTAIPDLMVLLPLVETLKANGRTGR